MKRKQLFLMVFLSLFAVITEAQETVESLKEQIENSGGKRKVDLMLELATFLGDEEGDYETALTYCQEALALAKSLNYLEGEANAYRRIGSAYANMEEYSKATEAYDKAQDLFQELKDDEGYYNVLIRKGTMAYVDGDVKKSEKYLKESIEFFSKSENLELLGEAYAYLGLVYQNENRLDEAFEYFSKAIELYRQIQSPDLASFLINLGDIYIAREDYQTALDLYLESLSLRESYEEEAVLGYLHQYISGLYDELGDYEKSIEHTQKALFFHQRQNDIAQIIDAQQKLSILYYELADFQGALNNNKELLDLYELSDSTAAYNVTLVDIGLCYAKLNNQTLAIQYYEKAKVAYQNAGELETVAAILVNIAESQMMLGDYDKAILVMEESISIRENNPESSLENLYFSKANLLDFYNFTEDFEKVVEIGVPLIEEVQNKNIPGPEAKINREVAIALGNLGRFEEALEYRKKALAIAIQRNDSYEMAEDYSFLISVYDEIENCEMVLKYCEESLPFYEEIGIKEYLAGIFYNAGFCYFKLEENKKGFAFFKKAFEVRKELGENETAGIIAFQIGEKHQELEEYEQAIQYYEEAKKNFTEQDDIQYVEQFIQECRQKLGK